MATHVTDITDIVNSTFDSIQENKLSDAATELQSYPMAERLLNKTPEVQLTGKQYTYNLLLNGDENTRAVALFEPDSLEQVDGTTTGTVPFRYISTGTHYDKKQISVNAGKEAIFSFTKKLAYQNEIGKYEKFESMGWVGATASTDSKTPYGLLGYWLVYNASEGFNGGNHSVWSGGPGGVDCTVSANEHYMNYTNSYTDVSSTDLVKKIKKALRKCAFTGIKNKPIAEYSGTPRYGIYTTEPVLDALETLLEAGNDNIGMDLLKYKDSVMLARNPVEWVPYLTNNFSTSAPIIGLDWNAYNVGTVKGEYGRTTPFSSANTNSHDIFARHEDWTLVPAMEKRRSSFLIAKSDPVTDYA